MAVDMLADIQDMEAGVRFKTSAFSKHCLVVYVEQIAYTAKHRTEYDVFSTKRR